jgi:hypothetical protein
MFRRDGEVFRLGTAMAEELLIAPQSRIDPRRDLARWAIQWGGQKQGAE